MLLKSVFFAGVLAALPCFSQDLCGTHKILQEQLKNESFRTKFEQDRILLKEHLLSQREGTPNRSTVYVIPVVFHVLHNGGIENVSRDQILDALSILNRDYRRQNPDAANVAPTFQGMPADVEVQFQLATKTPAGTCFNGVTRTQSELSYSEDGWGQVAAIIDGNDVYAGEWPGDQYLNIFICGNIGFGAAGYTYLPGSIGPSMYNGIWVLHDYVGSIGTGEEGRSRVLTHEVGHWLDLPHTWGYTNDPGIPENCDSDDGIDDTPNTVGSTWCNLSQNSCGPVANVENYMDYSYCSKMFTEGQKERMRGTLTSFVDGRNNLWTAQNIAATGADGNFYLCEAKFEQNRSNICRGESIQFTDLSFNKATSWNWYFEGGIPSTSTEQHPLITYPESGVFSVKLIVSDGITTDSLIKTNALSVLSGSLSLPYYEDFEDVSILNESSGWKVDNPQLNETFKIANFTGSSGTKSAYIDNFQQFGGTTVDELISSPIDLSQVDSIVTLSFRFAYHRKPGVNNEKLQVFVSSDCGQSWQLKKSLSGLLLTDQELFESYIPVSADEFRWAHITNILSSSFTQNFRYKFKFIGDGGNNIYIDDINIYPGPPSETVISQSGLDEIDHQPGQNELIIYPNPAKNVVNLIWFSSQTDKITYEISNSIGQKVTTEELSVSGKEKDGKSVLTLSDLHLPAGVYHLKLIQNDQIWVKKLILE